MSRRGALQYPSARINIYPMGYIIFCLIPSWGILYSLIVSFPLFRYAFLYTCENVSFGYYICASHSLRQPPQPAAKATACASSALCRMPQGFCLLPALPTCSCPVRSSGTPGGRASCGRESSPSQKFPRTKADFSRKLTSKSIPHPYNTVFASASSFPLLISCSFPARNLIISARFLHVSAR